MNTLFFNRSFASLLVVLLWVSLPAKLYGDDPQAMLRFFGHGWGRGYHSYPTQYGCVNRPIWIQQTYRCPDKYSRQNFSDCHGESCGYVGGVRFGNSPSHLGTLRVPPVSAGTQYGEMPFAPQPQSPYRIHANDRPVPRANNLPPMNPNAPKPQSILRNQVSPLPREPRTNSDPLLPQINESNSTELEDLQPLENLDGSGTKENPFGASRSRAVSPQGFNQRVSGLTPRTELASPAGPRYHSIPHRAANSHAGLAPVANQANPYLRYPASNTFNGIR